jgi:hypothetical protein
VGASTVAPICRYLFQEVTSGGAARPFELLNYVKKFAAIHGRERKILTLDRQSQF